MYILSSKYGFDALGGALWFLGWGMLVKERVKYAWLESGLKSGLKSGLEIFLFT